jgi:malonyl-CoA O-methyltransferase
LQLTFEVVYGHAFKPTPRFAMQAESRVPLMQLKSVLGKKK